jgi:peroxin-14
MVEKGKEGSNTAMLELQQELRSLKTLILNAGGRASGSPMPVTPSPIARPSIPAWQLGPASSSQATPDSKDSEVMS